MATNPYLQDQANAITSQANQNLQLNQLPGIGSGAVAAGGYGGSRQGVAEGVATGLTNQGITNSLANLYGTNYQQDQANDIARQQVGNNYNLGLGSLASQNQQQNYNFYTQNRGLDQSGAQLGANLYTQGTQGNVGQGQGLYNVGQTEQQAPWQTLGNAGNIFSQYSGLGGGQTQTQNGSALGAAAGGALLGSQLFSNLGLGASKSTTPTPASNDTSSLTNFYSNPANTNPYAGSYNFNDPVFGS